jgi:hypothetical protein
MKLNLTDTQKEMLRKGYRRAQELPRGFNMGTWGYESEQAPCGTICCYAGELLIVGGVVSPKELPAFANADFFAVPTRAAELLEIPDEAIKAMFFVENWPRELRKKYEAANIPSVRAEALAEAVEMFIAADGDTSSW